MAKTMILAVLVEGDTDLEVYTRLCAELGRVETRLDRRGVYASSFVTLDIVDDFQRETESPRVLAVFDAVAKADEPPTRVVFRTWRDTGAVIALFPDVPFGGGLCSSYMHVGQHGGADYGLVIGKTRPATAEEYDTLKDELEGIGYRLAVRQRR